MGARGPKRTPTATLKARGSWLADTRADGDVPLFPVDEPSCPSWLVPEAKAEWRRVVKYLMDAGLLAKANRAALTAYCICWGELHEAEKEVQEGGAVLTSAKGFKYPSPWLNIRNGALTTLVKLAAEFGMTPASASRVTASKEQAEEKPDGKSKERFFGKIG